MLAQLLADASGWVTALTSREVLHHLGSPFADAVPPPEEKIDAA
jgi:hypothetical protein